MDCPSEQQIYDYILDLEEGGSDVVLDEHIVGCEKCREHFNRLKQLGGQMEDLVSEQEPAHHKIAEKPVPDKIGEYEVVKEISRGGMGTVYLAEDTALERLVAIKVIRHDMASKKEFQERFMTEARILAQLQHPHIVLIHNSGQDKHGLHLVMEYVDGCTVNDLYGLDLNKRLDIFEQILLGVSEAHRKGILHRDLKPSNMMVNREGVLKILDFGIASSERFSSGYTSAGQVMGTYAYLAPEILHGGHYTVYSDIYSLGIIFYQLVSGTKPDKRMEAINKGNPLEQSPEELGLILKGELELQNYMEKFLELQPQKRYATVDEASEVLKKIRAKRAAETVQIIPENNPGTKTENLYEKNEAANLISRAAEIKRKEEGMMSEEDVKEVASQMGVEERLLQRVREIEAHEKKKKITLAIVGLAASLFIGILIFNHFMSQSKITSGDGNRLLVGLENIEKDKLNRSKEFTKLREALHEGASKTLLSDLKKIRLAMIPFKNASGVKEYDGLAASSADAIMVPLSNVDRIELPERLQLNEVLKEVDFNQSNYIDPEFALRLGKLTSVDALVMGILQKSGTKVRIIVRVVSAKTGKVIYSESIEGDHKKIFELQDELGKSLAKKF